ncbi:uncharacterized protein LOC134288812 [Aedes albopictus]|uniref:Secreted protein n=1 Tax=Aedes albopictus TaxID=7160 RepID=A0ABM1YXF6_AEDAL
MVSPNNPIRQGSSGGSLKTHIRHESMRIFTLQALERQLADGNTRVWYVFFFLRTKFFKLSFYCLVLLSISCAKNTQARQLCSRNSPGSTERNNLQSVGASSSTSAPLTRTSSQAEQSVATIAKKLSATLRRIPAEFKAELEVNHIRKVVSEGRTTLETIASAKQQHFRVRFRTSRELSDSLVRTTSVVRRNKIILVYISSFDKNVQPGGTVCRNDSQGKQHSRFRLRTSRELPDVFRYSGITIRSRSAYE